jgi:hypothetical protein
MSKAPERQAWLALGLRRRRQVLRLARKGHQHPDAAVAKVAHQWAISVLSSQRDGNSSASAVNAAITDSILGVAGSAVTGIGAGAALADATSSSMERRIARRIIAAQ